jgi:hypothetical protein
MSGIEIAGLVLGRSPIISALSAPFQRSRRVQSLYADTGTTDWNSISGRYIAIFDTKFNSNHPPDTLVETGTQTPHQLSNLPPQATDSCRVFIVHNATKDRILKTHVEQMINEPFDTFYDGRSPSIASSLNRRLENDQMPWWQAGLYTFGPGSSLQGLFEDTIRCHINLRCVWRDGRMLCRLFPINFFLSSAMLTRHPGFIFCDAEAASYNTTLPAQRSRYSAAMCAELSRLKTIFGHLQASFFDNQVNCTSRSMQQRMVIFRLCSAVIIKNAEFLSGTESLYRVSLRHLDDPGRTTITSANLRIFSRDSYFWELIHQNIIVFLTAVESFLSSLQLAENLSDPIEFRELIIEVHGQSTILEKRASSISARLENRLKFLEIGRSLHETGRVQLLSLLAVVFLPLSLASSILSMQTRFVDLHYLLYDFFGVIFLLGTLTFVLLGVLLLLQWGYGKLYNWMESPTLFSLGPRWRAGKYAPFVTIFAFLAPWGLAVASCFGGMIYDIGLGLKILGYGFGGITILFIAILLLFRLVSWRF